MSITYEEALSTLASMFGPPWTQDTLDAVLRHHEGHMENTVETVLAHGDGDPAELVRRLKNPPASPSSGESGGGGGGAAAPGASEHVDMDEELARQLSAEPERPARGQQQVRPTGLDGTPLPGPAGRSPPGTTQQQAGESPAPSPGRKNRGTPTQLPPDFLRVPGRSSDIDADEQLARMLQDELFTQELANNPEFAHLAGAGRGRGRVASAGRGRGAAAAPTGLGGHPLAGFPGWGRGLGGARGQQQEGPKIMENLKDMGDAARRRLALFAQQFNERMQNQGQGAGAAGAGGQGGTSGSAAERRGLLDGDGEGDEEVSFLGRKDSDVEMTSPSGKKND